MHKRDEILIQTLGCQGELLAFVEASNYAKEGAQPFVLAGANDQACTVHPHSRYVGTAFIPSVCVSLTTSNERHS